MKQKYWLHISIISIFASVIFISGCAQQGEKMFSDASCVSNMDCSSNFPVCFAGTCANATDKLKEYILNNYETEDCTKPCKGCKLETLVPSYIGYHDFEIEFCIECSGSDVLACNEGYECRIGKCVKS